MIPTLPILICFSLLSPVSVEQQIRQLRHQQNEAIAAQNLDAIRSVWANDIQVTISSGAHLNGSDAYLKAFETVFNDIPGVRYIRKPIRIEISEDGKRASEQGSWQGIYPNQTVGKRTGTYMASWRKEASGAWLIAAELYVPLRSTK